MDRIIYTAASGANAVVARQQALANNLANVSTPGFRAEMSTYRAVPLNGSGAATRVFALEATAGHREQAGPITMTGRNLDVAARDNAYFAVQTLNGTEGYTRAGALEVREDGSLVNPQGLPMLDAGGAPIAVPPGATVQLGADGTISARVGNDPVTVVGRLKLVTPTPDDPIKRGEDGFFRSPTGEPLPADPNARMQDGALEGSNVNPIEAMVGMIQVARQFEQQMRLLQTAEKNDQTASQLLGLS
ncbi:MAG: flagellar basal-body rod protein FlgF [Burkholderiaceae bacterium]|nr:flagellar basal-body rod protein FlgF [Burkholderiaceae bacterium]MDP3423790.1 flagellar basal-body rod protein FlgF [Burkholderiaceae bacterium]MDZ4160508.1 flagellar basal-body rod protein FlgF [Burkholderiales bacterium]